MTPLPQMHADTNPPCHGHLERDEEELSFSTQDCSLTALLQASFHKKPLTNDSTAQPQIYFFERRNRFNILELSDCESSSGESTSDEDSLCYSPPSTHYISESNTPEPEETKETQDDLNKELKKTALEIQLKVNNLLYVKVSTFKNPNILFHRAIEEDLVLSNKLLEVESKKKRLLVTLKKNRNFPWECLQYKEPISEAAVYQLTQVLEECKEISLSLSLLQDRLSPIQKELFDRYEDYKTRFPHDIY